MPDGTTGPEPGTRPVDPYAAPRTEEGQWRCPECGWEGDSFRRHFADTHAMHPYAALYRQEFRLEKISSQLSVLIIFLVVVPALIAFALVLAGNN